jgi:protein involved in polysaccharide export with SLBB domain
MYRLEAGMTVVQAISRSGGLTPRGSDSRIEIKRQTRRRQVQNLQRRSQRFGAAQRCHPRQREDFLMSDIATICRL